MSATRRLMILLGAPLVLAVGLGVFWGVERGSAVVERIEGWVRAFEHEPGPVAMAVSSIPVVSRMHVDGARIGRLDSLVVLREQPGTVDSVRLVVMADPGVALGEYADCRFLVDLSALEGTWPLDGVKQVVQCVSDTTGLVPFGSVVFAGADSAAGLFLHAEHLPCTHMTESAPEACADIRLEMRKLRNEIRHEVRQEIRSARQTVRESVKP